MQYCHTLCDVDVEIRARTTWSTAARRSDDGWRLHAVRAAGGSGCRLGRGYHSSLEMNCDMLSIRMGSIRRAAALRQPIGSPLERTPVLTRRQLLTKVKNLLRYHRRAKGQALSVPGRACGRCCTAAPLCAPTSHPEPLRPGDVMGGLMPPHAASLPPTGSTLPTDPPQWNRTSKLGTAY